MATGSWHLLLSLTEKQQLSFSLVFEWYALRVLCQLSFSNKGKEAKINSIYFKNTDQANRCKTNLQCIVNCIYFDQNMLEWQGSTG